MTTDDSEKTPNIEVLSANIQKIEELSQRLVAAFARKRDIDPNLQGPAPDLFVKAATGWMASALADPTRILERQVEYWGKSLQHFIEAQEKLQELATGEAEPEPETSDNRFASPLWAKHPYFNFIKQQYLLNARAAVEAAREVEGLDAHDKRRLEYFTRQIVDMMSPANFLATNPEALTRAMETDGESLVRGLENLVRDLEANDGELLVTLADKNAFEVGGNLATTKGAVVFRNRLFELIQYAPTTDKVHKTPLIIFPPWINRFYILDLKPENSLVKWIVDQGFTLFVVSWVNPDASYRDFGMDSYISEGYLAAIDAVRDITGEQKVNAVGYCIAGTTLALTLSLLARRKNNPIKSATFLTTLVDFSDQGEFEAFLDDDFVDAIEHEVDEHGYLDKFYMARTFSFLRANDLIYRPAIRSYMMGEAPPAFDLLYWNGDGTNLPARMAVEYLRWLCQENRFVHGKFPAFDTELSVRDIKLPVFAVACESDHIAAWKSSYAGIHAMASRDKTFVLSGSGHIAGIINPPSKNKYDHWTNGDLPDDADDWRAAATRHDGSWWPLWAKWLADRSGAKVAARQPGNENYPVLAAAPGTYVIAQPGA